jgi:hypothetical protein
MQTRALTYTAALLAALAAPAAAQQDTPGGQAVHRQGQVTLTGRVVDAATGAPIRAAHVVVPDARVDVYTDEEGRFTASRVAPGAYGAVVSVLGYRERAEIWEVAQGQPAREVRLAADAVMLQALNVEAGRLERRARASGWGTQAYARDLLATSNERDAAKFIREFAHIQPVDCATLGRGTGAPNCIRVRGAATAACVLLDDSPSSFGELAAYRPKDLYRVEVFGGGRAILVYTNDFAENIARTGYSPPPLQAQVDMYCRKSASLN